MEIIDDGDEDGKILSDRVSLRDELHLLNRGIGATTFYKNIIVGQTAMDKYPLLYKRIFKTLFNLIKVVQFLSLYLLYEFLSKGKSSPAQRHVTEFIQENRHRYPKISFIPSRRNNRNEDSLTYLRNEISHSEDTNDFRLYSEIGTKITNTEIKLIINVLNDVIMTLP